MKELFSLCHSGLANRLHVMLGAERIAAATGRKLRVYWPLNEMIGAKFKRLFVNGFDFINRTDVDNIFHTALRVKVYNVGNGPTRVDECSEVLRDDQDDIVVIKAWYCPKFKDEPFINVQNYMRTRLQQFKPVPEVVDILNKHRAFFDAKDPIVGVHVRYATRSDTDPSGWCPHSMGSFALSSVDLFSKSIERILSKKPSTKFFVSSVNPLVETTFHDRFKGHVYFVPKTEKIYTLTVQAMREALADMIMLSQTKFLLGTHYSQFSQTAAEYGNIPLVEVGAPNYENVTTVLTERL